MATTITIPNPVARTRDAFIERMLENAAGAFSVFTMHIGSRLGFYRTLAEAGPLTPGKLAVRTGTKARYVREWCEQQTVAGILDVENPDDPASARRFFLPAGHDEVLTDTESLNYLGPLPTLVVGAGGPMDEVMRAFRHGGGISYEVYGDDLRKAQGDMNRTTFLQQLGQEWIPAMPDVDRRLRLESGARVADFGCGVGWSSIGLARCYPSVAVDGFDLDMPSIDMARVNAAESGVADRVRFHVRDAADPELAGKYDLVMACECLHDMANPVGALETMRRMLAPGGSVIIVDERTGERFTRSGTEVEPILYGFSVLHCLPVGMTEPHSPGTGTCMRASTLAEYARQAGFTETEVLPVGNIFLRVYRLR